MRILSHLSGIANQAPSPHGFTTMPEEPALETNRNGRADFDQIVERALRNIPARFRRRMDNVAIVVEDEPALASLGREESRQATRFWDFMKGTR